VQNGNIQTVSMGAALEFVEQLLGGPVTQLESAPTVNATVKQLLNNNGDRVGLLLVNLGSFNVNVGPTAAIAGASGIPLVASGGFLSLNVRDDFTFASREWYAGQGNAGGSVIYILEYVRVSREVSLNPALIGI
jgi:hypothetical protein